MYSKLTLYIYRTSKMREKSAEGSSDGDRTFNFNIQMDLSDRRGKTGQTFKHQSALDFDDFKDFRQDNKTQKSQILSQKKWLPSDLVKKSDQSMIIPQNPTELSIRKHGGSFIAQNRYRQGQDNSRDQKIFISQGASPKFNDQKFYQTVSSSQFQKNLKDEVSAPQKLKLASKFSVALSNQIDQVDQKSPNRFTSPKFNDKAIGSLNISNSRNKQPSSARFTPEAEYKDILNSIQYYENQNDKLDYETIKLMMEIEKYKNMLQDNPSFDYQIQKLTQETNIINSQISNQRSLEKTLIQNKKIVEEEFDQIAQSIDCLKFQRPIVIRDQTKAIIDEINSLKSQFESLRRDEGSLNFSTSLANPTAYQISSETRPAVPIINSSPQFDPEQMLMGQARKQIMQASKNRLNFVYNIKMMIIKDEWKMYQDPEICVSCSTRDYPMLEVRIGNKSVRNFSSFCIKEGANVIADKEVLQAKCYYIHSMKMNRISHPFMKFQIFYFPVQPVAQDPPTVHIKKSLTLFLPTLPLKHGQFIPITQKQYQQESTKHRNLLLQSQTLQKPIDTSIIHESLKQLQLFFPHLLYEINQKGQQICKGIFRLWNSSQGAIVKIRKKNNTVDIKVRNNISFLLQSLEFLLTILI